MAKRKTPKGLFGKSLADKVGRERKHLPASIASQQVAQLHDHLSSLSFPESQVRPAYGDLLMGLGAITTCLALLAGMKSIDALTAKIDEAEDYYVPGGPPMSAVHDSMFMTWSLLDLAHGRRGDTASSVTQRLHKRLQLERFFDIAQLERLGNSRLGIYEVRAEHPEHLTLGLRELVTEQELTMCFSEEFPVGVGDLLLLRLVELPKHRAREVKASHISSCIPYVLLGSTPVEWLDYLERAAGELKMRLDPDAYVLVMSGVGDERRWLEYIVDGYCGERAKNVVELMGVPDRPETLPHHLDHGEAEARGIPPGTPNRERATILSRRMWPEIGAVAGSLEPAQATALADVCRTLIDSRPEKVCKILVGFCLSVVFYFDGALDQGVAPARDADLSSRLDDDAREWIACASEGWVSLFDVVGVTPGQSLRVCDLLTDREYSIHERAASREMRVGSVLCGRVVEYRGETLFDDIAPMFVGPDVRAALVAAVRSTLGVQPGPIDHRSLRANALKIIEAHSDAFDVPT